LNNNDHVDVEGNESINSEQRPVFSVPIIPLEFPRRPAPPIPTKKPTISEQPTENIYLSAMPTPPSVINDLSKSPSKNHEEIQFGEKVTIK
jgi:hypothetical protein